MRRVLVILGLLLLGGGVLLVEAEIGPVLMLLGAACFTGVFLIGRARDALDSAADRRARAAGTLAPARVLTVRKTGRSSEDSSIYEVTLLVRVRGRPEYTATVIGTISWWYTREGNVVPVTVSATDPQRIWIEYPPNFPNFRADQF